MVRLYYVSIFYKHPQKSILLCSSNDLTAFGYFQRNSILEFMTFTSQMLVERCEFATRISVKEQAYMCHIYVHSNGLSATLISDHDYPHRSAYTLLNKVLEEFSNKIPATAYVGTEEPNAVIYPEIEKYLTEFQDPRNADSILKIQDELDETKIILHNTLQAVLKREEKLDDLVEKSKDLSFQSKTFYKTARKTNSCCIII